MTIGERFKYCSPFLNFMPKTNLPTLIRTELVRSRPTLVVEDIRQEVIRTIEDHGLRVQPWPTPNQLDIVFDENMPRRVADAILNYSCLFPGIDFNREGYFRRDKGWFSNAVARLHSDSGEYNRASGNSGWALALFGYKNHVSELNAICRTLEGRFGVGIEKIIGPITFGVVGLNPMNTPRYGPGQDIS